jgi:hypothetical protein
LEKLGSDDDALLVLAKSRDAMKGDTIDWLNQQIKSSKLEREKLETELVELKAEEERLKICETEPAKVAKVTKTIIDRLFDIDPIKQRAFLREVISKIVVTQKNQLIVHWALPGGEPGSTESAGANETNRHDQAESADNLVSGDFDGLIDGMTAVDNKNSGQGEMAKALKETKNNQNGQIESTQGIKGIEGQSLSFCDRVSHNHLNLPEKFDGGKRFVSSLNWGPDRVNGRNFPSP